MAFAEYNGLDVGVGTLSGSDVRSNVINKENSPPKENYSMSDCLRTELVFDKATKSRA